MNDQTALLHRVKTGIVIMLAIFAVHLVADTPEYWPITRWGMYQHVGPPPEQHIDYRIEAADSAGNQHMVYGWELSFRGGDVIHRAFNEGEIDTYGPLLVDIVQQQMPDTHLTHLSFWRAEWNVDATGLPPFNPESPDQLTLLGQFPAAFYTVDQPSDSTVDLHFGDAFGLLDFHILGEQTVAPCDTIFIHTGWQALQQPQEDYQITLVLADENGIGQAQSDGPLANEYTSTWQPESTHLDRRTLAVPCEFAPGEYSLLVGIYDLETVENLQVTYPDGSPYGLLAYLTTVTVEAGDETTE